MPNRTNSGTLAAGLCLLATVVFIVMTVALGAVPGAAGAARQHKIELRSTEGLWSRLVSPETARAVAADEQLQHTYLEAVELTADLTRRLADRFAMVPELREASASLEQYRRGLAANTKPLARRANPLESFGELLGLPGASTSGVNMTAAMGGILSTITAPITKAVSGLGDSLINSAGGAALFLGTGLGAGAAQGLNLAPAAKTMQIAAKIAADNGMNATGLNPAIQNAAMGATASLLGSVNISSLGGGASVSSLDIKGIAMSLAMGIGNGTSAGLNLSPQAAALKPPPGNTTADIAGTFGFGLTKSVASNIDLSKVSMGSFNISQLTGSTPLSQFAVSLAAGLGSGAASGLKLTQANLAPPAGNTAPDALGAFGFGLTDSVSSNINTTSLLGSLKNMGGAGGALGNINLAQTASSFATGLGTGAAAGLKLSTNIVGAPDPNGQDVPSIAGNFAFGLTKSVTENFNASKLTSGSGAGGSSALAGLTGSLDIGRVAQGAAMGLLQGAGDAVNSMGGLQALINGTAVMSTQPLPANNMAFNDSVGGAATGFGQGLGGQGTLVGIQLLAQVNVTSLVNGFLNGNPTAAGAAAGAAEAAPASAPAPAMAPAAAPSNGTVVMMRKRAGDHFLPAEIVRRQADAGTINNNNSFNLSALINADTISSVGQRALDALSCEGIGGLILVGLGLVESGTITFGSANKLNATLIKQILPKGVLRFNSGGNTYTIDGTIIANNIDSNLLGAAGGVVVNGNPVISFVAFLVAHILIAILAFVVLIPLVLSLDAARNLLVRLKLSHVLPKIPGWINLIWFWLMSPLAILTLVFGALAGGTSGHFRTVHGVLGLLTVLATLGGSAAHLVAKATSPAALRDAVVLPTRPFRLLSPLTARTLVNQSLLMLVLPAVVTGLADLSAASLCATRVVSLEAAVGLAAGLTFLYTVASALSSLTLLLATREVRRAKRMGGGGGGAAGGGGEDEDWGSNSSLKEKISVVRHESARGGRASSRDFERD